MILRHTNLRRDVRPSFGCIFIVRVRMADSGSSRYSSETDLESDLSLSTSSSSELSEDIHLSGPLLETEILPYRFEPTLAPTDADDGVHAATLATETEASPVDRVGNTDW